jgi:ribosomal protein L37AE/L43A
MATFSNKIADKSTKQFFCNICDYYTSHKGHFDEHLISLKHVSRNKIATISNTKIDVFKNYCCENCGKEYTDRTGLWRHKKKCKISDSYSNFSEEDKTNNNMITGLTEQLVIELVKQNKELLEIVKNGTTKHSHNTTHTNSHNKAFNLQFFLNETCKEAMNIGEFVDSLKIQLSDLEHIGEAGYIEGISNIIVKNLKDLDVTKRPVHCTDKKRETVYIKDNNIWEKDDNKSHMHKLIKKVVSKNTKMFAKFKEAHPDCLTYHSKYSEQYNKIVYESMGGKGDDDDIKNEKIIKNVLKEVIVNKASESDT